MQDPIRRLLHSFHGSNRPHRLFSILASVSHQHGGVVNETFPRFYHHNDSFKDSPKIRRPSFRLTYLSTNSSNNSNNQNDDRSNKNKLAEGNNSTTPQLPSRDVSILAQVQAALPGVALATATCLTGFTLASSISAATNVSLSGIPVAIVLGILVRTATGVPTLCQPGLTLSAKSILQLGIVCVGIKLSVWQLATASTTSVPVVLAAVTAGMVGIPRIATAMGIGQSSLCLVPLLTAGTSICGVTAISALAPAIHAPHQDVAVAVANTVAFGTIGMLFYPYILHTLVGYDSTAVGLTLGVAIHDTSQVMGAALSYKESYGDETAFELAAVTKLVRNLGLAAAIPYLTYQHQRNHPSSTSSDEDAPSARKPMSIREETMSGLTTFTKIVPPFLMAFLCMSVLRSIGDVTIMTAGSTQAALYYDATVSFIGNHVSKYALGTAMAATGLSIDANSLRTVGWRPFALGGASAMLVGGVGCSTALAVSYASSVWA